MCQQAEEERFSDSLCSAIANEEARHVRGAIRGCVAGGAAIKYIIACPNFSELKKITV